MTSVWIIVPGIDAIFAVVLFIFAKFKLGQRYKLFVKRP